jgi:hypothetical protein
VAIAKTIKGLYFYNIFLTSCLIPHQIFFTIKRIIMPDKIIAAAEKLAAFELVLPQRAGEDFIIREIIVDSPILRTIGRQIVGCFEIGEYQRGSIYDKIAQSVTNVLNEASVQDLLVLRNNIAQNAKAAQ